MEVKAAGLSAEGMPQLRVEHEDQESTTIFPFWSQALKEIAVMSPADH